MIVSMDFSKELQELLDRAHYEQLKDRQFLEQCCSLVEKTERIDLHRMTLAGEWKIWECLMKVLLLADVSRIKTLHFATKMRLKEDEIVGLAEVLATGRFSGLQSLRFYGGVGGLGRGGSEAVARALKKGGLTNLRELELPECDVKMVLESIESADLTSLKLGGGSSVKWVTRKVETATGFMDIWESLTPVADVLEKTLTRGQWLHLEKLGPSFDGLGGQSGFAALVHGIERGKLPALKSLSLLRSERSLGANSDLARLVVRDWFESLTHLHLKACGITPQQVSGLVEAIIRAQQALALQDLELSFNALDDTAIDALVRLATSDLVPQLAELTLSFNKLLSSQSLHKLVDAIQRGHLPSLKTLAWWGTELTNSDAEAIVDAYFQNDGLTTIIDINWGGKGIDRSLETKAKELRERNVRLRAIKEDLKDGLAKDVEFVPVRKAKVFLCGAGEVGKTTLRKSLQGKEVEMNTKGSRRKFKWDRRSWSCGLPVPHVAEPRIGGSGLPRAHDAERRTRGIEMCRVLGNDLELILWDLAGQDEFHVMHGSFFINLGLESGKATTFVIVLKVDFTSVEAHEEQLKYWLRFIASSSFKQERQHVVIVFNLFDGTPCTEIQQNGWCGLIEGFVKMFADFLDIYEAPFFIDVREASLVEDLKDFLFKQAGKALQNVKLAQDREFGQREGSEYRAKKSYLSFKFGSLRVYIEFDMDTSHRVDIMVKSLGEDSIVHPDLTRSKQLECISKIMLTLEILCAKRCPGVSYDMMAMKLWSAMDDTPKMSEREVMSVSDIKRRIGKDGMENETCWDVNGETVMHETLLSLRELEEVHVTVMEVYYANNKDVLALGLVEEDPSSMTKKPEVHYGEILGRDTESDELVCNNSTMGEVSVESGRKPILTTAVTRRFFVTEMEKLRREIDNKFESQGKLILQHFDKRFDEMKKSLSDIKEKQLQLVRDVQDLHRFSVEALESNVPRFLFLSKVNQGDKGAWLSLEDAFHTTFRLHFLCEARYDDRVIHEVMGQEGLEIKNPKEWLVKISPWLRRSLQVAVFVAKIAASAIVPGLGLLIPDFSTFEGPILASAVDSVMTAATTSLMEHVGEGPGGKVLEGNHGSAQAPINVKDKMIAQEAVVALMHEVGNVEFARKIGLRRVRIGRSFKLGGDSSKQAQPSVKWICDVCFWQYRSRDVVTDITCTS